MSTKTHMIEGYEFIEGELYALGEATIICMGEYLLYLIEGDRVLTEDLLKYPVCHLSKQPPMVRKWYPKNGEVVIKGSEPMYFHTMGQNHLKWYRNGKLRPLNERERGE